MAMPEVWTAQQAADYLGIEMNNLYQITNRFKKIHAKMNHKDNGLCPCLLVEHKGRRESYYRTDKVKAYALYRKGEMTDIGRLITKAREATKIQRPGVSKGRPTNKVKR